VFLEALTVCVNYGDFLAVAAEQNRALFDRWLVVTTAEDEETREVCRHFNLDTLITREGITPGREFNKGFLIERGLQQLSIDSWHWHLDADVILPAHTRHALQVARLDPEMIYGFDRVMVRSWNDWVRLRDSGYLQQQWRGTYELHFPPGFDVGTRWMVPQSGWVPIGFSQLWHGSAEHWRGTRVRGYPTNHSGASHTDVRQSLQWDRRRRELLAEIITVHLESEPCAVGSNWQGRNTQRFGPPTLAAPRREESRPESPGSGPGDPNVSM
jgi:hypothetical protein